eukprot:gene8023-12488_t
MKLLVFVVVLIVSLSTAKPVSEENINRHQLRFYLTKDCSGNYIHCPPGCCSIPGALYGGKKTESVKATIDFTAIKVTRYEAPNCSGSSESFLWKVNTCTRSPTRHPLLTFRGQTFWGGFVAYFGHGNTEARSK